jgi:hypothetical protein
VKTTITGLKAKTKRVKESWEVKAEKVKARRKDIEG